MGGKLPLLGIVGFGLFAAICAAVLMAVLRIEPSGASARAAPTTASVVIAARDLDALSRITADALTTKDIALGDVPEGGFSDPSLIIGRVVSEPLLTGQAVTENALLDEVGGAKLALSLPEGLRAVSIELSATSALRGLLYPGCTVDVIGVPRNDADRSRILVQNVRVLAVNDRTLYAAETEGGEDDDEPVRRTAREPRSTMVTLMVTPEQARTLQAARERGPLSLSLRNPLDNTATAEPSDQPATTEATGASAPDTEPDRPRRWTVRVVRGGEASTRTFGGDDGLQRIDNSTSTPAPSPAVTDDPPSGDDQ